jgi:hypothetical protein
MFRSEYNGHPDGFPVGELDGRPGRLALAFRSPSIVRLFGREVDVYFGKRPDPLVGAWCRIVDEPSVIDDEPLSTSPIPLW